MRIFKLFSFTKTIALICTLALGQSIHAQSQDSIAADTTLVAQQQTTQVAKPEPKRKFFIIAKVSTNKILARMPQYKAVQRNLNALKDQYEAEAQKSENDFQRKFEEFMQGQKEFPKTILEKRQNELQNMLETNAAFRIKVQALLAEAEKSMMNDVKAELNDAITAVAQERGVSIMFDMDGGSVPYVTPGLAVDLTNDVIKLLGIDETSN